MKFAVPAMLATTVMAPAANSASKRDADRGEAVQSSPAGPPVMAVVWLKGQRVSLCDAGGKATGACVSSGQTGYDTTVGIYSVLEKDEEAQAPVRRMARYRNRSFGVW